jgi:hypothetical protein
MPSKDWAKFAYPKACTKTPKRISEEHAWRVMWDRRAEEFWENFAKTMALDTPVGMSVYRTDDELLDDVE